MASITLLVALLSLAIIVAKKVETFLALKHFGGHWSAGWTRLWQIKAHWSGEMNIVFSEINRRYGSTARIAPKTLVTEDPDLIRRMNAVSSKFTKGPFYKSFQIHPEFESVVTQEDEQVHAKVRAQIAPGYSTKENPFMEQYVDERVLALVDLIDRKYVTIPERGTFKTADLSRLSQFFTLDVVSKVTFSRPFGFLDKDEDIFGYLDLMDQFMPMLVTLGVFHELSAIMRLPFMKYLLPRSTDKRGLGKIMYFAEERLQERYGEKAITRQDMVQSFIRHGRGQHELEAESLQQIIAGSDSTATTLRMALHYIGSSPPVLEHLLTELRTGIAAGRVSRPVMKNEEAYELPYLQACIKETLRICPPVAALLAKLVPASGIEINVDGEEKFVPSGVQIAWNPWGVMRNAAIFGPDAEIFRPERWLPKDGSEREKARVSRMAETVGLCFGYGRFGCLGKHVAIMELNKAIPEVLLRYNLQPANMKRPFDERTMNFFIHKNMDYVITERGDSIGSLGVVRENGAISTVDTT